MDNGRDTDRGEDRGCFAGGKWTCLLERAWPPGSCETAASSSLPWIVDVFFLDTGKKKNTETSVLEIESFLFVFHCWKTEVPPENLITDVQSDEQVPGTIPPKRQEPGVWLLCGLPLALTLPLRECVVGQQMWTLQNPLQVGVPETQEAFPSVSFAGFLWGRGGGGGGGGQKKRCFGFLGAHFEYSV